MDFGWFGCPEASQKWRTKSQPVASCESVSGLGGGARLAPSETKN